jgi:uncharacterized protein (TIGR02145 family)
MKNISLILFSFTLTIVTYAQENGNYTDLRDGKGYKTVKIGTQIWFAENIAFKVDSGCWAYNNCDSSVYKYGYLYNWETAQKVCPTGWHAPSNKEWTILTEYLGGITIAGGKMKAIKDWKPDVKGNATNSSGFNALPTGRRGSKNGIYSHLGASTSFWSSTLIDSMQAFSFGLHFNSEDVHSGNNIRANGFCVRCIKD